MVWVSTVSLNIVSTLALDVLCPLPLDGVCPLPLDLPMMLIMMASRRSRDEAGIQTRPWVEDD